MIAMLRDRPRVRLQAFWLWLAAYAALAPALLGAFVRVDSAAFWTGAIACVLLAGAPPRRTASMRWGWAALCLAALYFVLPVGTVRYLALGAAALFVLESRRGRQGFLLPLNLLIMSPVFGNISGTVSFPLRLQLTRVAGALLGAGGGDVAASGNMIRSGGTDFSVDPACMGLHMLQCALLCAIMITAVYRQRYARVLPGYWIGVVLLICLLLNIVSNLLRIVMLVQFRLAPETAMHEIVGVLCLVVYVLLPCGLLIGWLTRRFGRAERELHVTPMRSGGLLHAAVLLSLAGGLLANPPKWDRTSVLPQIPGYAAARADAGIVRLSQGDVVVYLKDLQGFYGSEHHPMLCWSGSGYKFREVRADRIAGVPLMRGVLERDGAQYQSAWWYSSGSARAYADAGWRWDALRHGRSYSIVNVTAPDAASLERQIRLLAASPGLSRWLQRTDR